MSTTNPTSTFVELDGSVSDYDCVRRAIAYVTAHRTEHPSLERIAEEVGLSASHFQKLFTRWAGLSPKAFLQAITLDHARSLLDGSASVLDTALETGLSGPGRLHDLFVTHVGLSPGEYKSRGEGLTMSYGVHPCPFGEAVVLMSPRGLCGLGFVDDAGVDAAISDLVRRFPRATFVRDDAATASLSQRVFEPQMWRQDQPLRVHLIGSDFEIRVWETLLRIPLGRATTYSDVAHRIGNPKGSRAVGAAVGRNPISFVVPCHRVIGRSGALTGYHWGLTRKQAMLGWEAGRVGS
jgi:AraC family transcriptional regulator, regulatory protein of adaptative response / methylated-DNA-[protein]-cysteine methyltransferase